MYCVCFMSQFLFDGDAAWSAAFASELLRGTTQTRFNVASVARTRTASRRRASVTDSVSADAFGQFMQHRFLLGDYHIKWHMLYVPVAGARIDGSECCLTGRVDLATVDSAFKYIADRCHVAILLWPVGAEALTCVALLTSDEQLSARCVEMLSGDHAATGPDHVRPFRVVEVKGAFSDHIHAAVVAPADRLGEDVLENFIQVFWEEFAAPVGGVRIFGPSDLLEELEEIDSTERSSGRGSVLDDIELTYSVSDMEILGAIEATDAIYLLHSPRSLWAFAQLARGSGESFKLVCAGDVTNVDTVRVVNDLLLEAEPWNAVRELGKTPWLMHFDFTDIGGVYIASNDAAALRSFVSRRQWPLLACY